MPWPRERFYQEEIAFDKEIEFGVEEEADNKLHKMLINVWSAVYGHYKKKNYGAMKCDKGQKNKVDR